MTRQVQITPPQAFGLDSFAAILPRRDPIVGEDLGSFDGFHKGMMITLAPGTPYEYVVAENLIAIEWELLQHRRMRDAVLRGLISRAIERAVVNRRKTEYDAAISKPWEQHRAKGGTRHDWKPPFQFDEAAAKAAGMALARRAHSGNPEDRAVAYAEIAAHGCDPVDLLAEAHGSDDLELRRHEEKIEGLERRRREVKRDFDALKKARPLEAIVADAEVIDP
jgi:hypothetical protein